MSDAQGQIDASMRVVLDLSKELGVVHKQLKDCQQDCKKYIREIRKLRRCVDSLTRQTP